MFTGSLGCLLNGEQTQGGVVERQEKDHCNGPRGDNGAQDQGESSGGGERWADTSSILKVESINLDIGFKRKSQGYDYKVWPEQLCFIKVNRWPPEYPALG